MPFYGMNLSVGLSISITGFGLQVADGEADRGERRGVGLRRPVHLCSALRDGLCLTL